jgi:hypothetical protein
MLARYLLSLLFIGTLAQWQFDSTPGALVRIRFKGQVATLIPRSTVRFPIPPDTLFQIASDLLNSPDQYWLAKIKDQVKFVLHRQVYRRQYALAAGLEGKGQLVLPPEQVWNITIDKSTQGARLQVRNRRRYVVVDYFFESVLVARRGSVKRAEPKLASIGDRYVESFIVPLDPEFFFQVLLISPRMFNIS